MMDIGNAVSTMVNNIAAQSDPSYRSNQEIMSAVAEQIKTNSRQQAEETTRGVGTMLIEHVTLCPNCKVAGELKDDCKIAKIMSRIIEKSFNLQ